MSHCQSLIHTSILALISSLCTCSTHFITNCSDMAHCPTSGMAHFLSTSLGQHIALTALTVTRIHVLGINPYLAARHTRFQYRPPPTNKCTLLYLDVTKQGIIYLDSHRNLRINFDMLRFICTFLSQQLRCKNYMYAGSCTNCYAKKSK